MKDRIKQIMDNENLTPGKFADRLQINRAVISHILNGRNNPSLDVVTKILTDMSYINSEWLLNGTGSMYKDGFDMETLPQEPDLFNQKDENPHKGKAKHENHRENELPNAENSYQSSINKQINIQKNESKNIAQIIIYYSDNTFETFIPNQVKLP